MPIKNINLNDIFAAVNYVSAPVLPPDPKGDQVLTYDHAASMVKRFAADDAMVYQVLSGQQACAYSKNTLISNAAHGKDEYKRVYKKAKPHRDANIGYIMLTKSDRLTIERASGYKSTRHLIYLITLAFDCHALLAPSFPKATRQAQNKVEMLAGLLDKKERARFPVFDSEAEALKNLALPSNPYQPALAFPDMLAEVYKTEFDRLKNRPTASGQRLQR